MPPPEDPPEDRNAEPNGGVASPLSASPDPPSGAQPAAPIPDPGDDSPPPRRWLSPRARSVLRVLLATLALGWWTQRAMRRHFEAGAYPGPLYSYTTDGRLFLPGLMDDTGRIIVPAGTWEEITAVRGPDETCWLVKRSTKTLVFGLRGALPASEAMTEWALFDGSGRMRWRSKGPPVMTRTRFDATTSHQVTAKSGLGMLLNRPQSVPLIESDRTQLITLDGQVVLEDDRIEIVGHGPLVWAHDYLPDAQSRNGGLARVLLWRDGRWIELASIAHSSISEDFYVPSVAGDSAQATVLGGVTVDQPAARMLYGVIRGDLRWRLPVWRQEGDSGTAIANAPGSQPGDPPVFTNTERLDGAWLAVAATDLRAVLADGLWGLQAADGHWLVDPRWTDVYEFDESTLLVTDAQGRQSIVDQEGRVRLPPVAAMVLWRVPQAGVDGAFVYSAYVSRPAPASDVPPPADASADDAAGQTTAPDSGMLDDFSGDALYGWLNEQGEWIVPPVFSDPISLQIDGDRGIYVGEAAGTGLLGVLRFDGTELLPPRYRTLMYLYEDRWYVKPAGEDVPSQDAASPDTGVIPPWHRWAWTVWQDGGRIIDVADDQVPPLDLQCELFSLMEDLGYLVVRQGKVGLVDLQGKDILPAAYSCLTGTGVPNLLLARDWQAAVDRPLGADDNGTSPSASTHDLSQTLPGGEYLQYRVFDLRTRTWLPQTLASCRRGVAIRSAKDGWGLLQPDLQTLMDYRALGLPGPMRTLEQPNRSWETWNPIPIPHDAPLYWCQIGDKMGLFLSDGRLLLPFISTNIQPVDARFIRLEVDGATVLMDRGGRLIVPGGETTWAALGAPGFVRLQHAKPAQAEAAATE